MGKKVVAIIGGRNCTKEVEYLAQELGEKMAKVADVLVCGGLSGVMAAVCQGFKKGEGITIGVLPGYNKNDANPFIDIALPTGIGLARNVLVVKSADAVVALPGESGTLSEIAYCLQFSIPVVTLVPRTSYETMTMKVLNRMEPADLPGVIKVETVEQAVEKVSLFIN